MTPDKAKQLSRMIFARRVKELLLPGFIGATALVFVGFAALNVPLSVEQSTCTLVRWTQTQTDTGPGSTIVFCDLTDGRTIFAKAGQSWTPPAAGSRLKLRIEHLVYGTRYVVSGGGG